MRTVIDRAPTGLRLDAATWVEIACILSSVSMKVPLNHAAAWIMWHALSPLLDDMEEPFIDNHDRTETIPGLISDACKALDKASPPEDQI